MTDDEKSCHKCGCAMSLLDEHEWPESDDLIYCSTCSIDVIRELRGTMAVSDSDNRTPGQVLYETLCFHNGDCTPWAHLDDDDRMAAEDAAVKTHAAVERQRREARIVTINCARCGSNVRLDHERKCASCGLVQSTE